MVVDHEQPVRFNRVRSGWRRFRPLEKMAQRHELVRLGDVLGAGRIQHEELTVARHPQIAVGLGFDLTELT